MDPSKRVHPMLCFDTSSSISLPPRPMDPKKDLAVYGYGTVAWKYRMEEWRRRQADKLEIINHQGSGGDPDDADLPKWMRGGNHCHGRYRFPQAR
ncbi:putative cellulose synthase (UDP-forming) [Helianthus annuus]|nr:putative cellulose synthase (UDP-forming) [Helianthus annuus]